MSQFFKFEAEFVSSLRCIPMQVRYKLDTCAIKLKLQHWYSFSLEQRQQLIDLPCDTKPEIEAYRETLRSLVFANFQVHPQDLPMPEQPDWMQLDPLPTSLWEHLQSLNLEITLQQWQSLHPLQRFVLLKLSTSNHEHSNFLPALKEFELI